MMSPSDSLEKIINGATSAGYAKGTLLGHYNTIDVQSSFSNKFSAYHYKGCRHKYDDYINHIKKLTNNFTELPVKKGVISSQKISLPKKIMKSKKIIFRLLS